MKKYLTILVLMLGLNIGYAQNEVVGYYGAAIPMGIKSSLSNIDVLYNQMIGIRYGYKFRLSKDVVFAPLVDFNSTAYIMDGSFTKSISGQYNFEITPSNYTQNLVRISSVKVPLMIGYVHRSMDSLKKNEIHVSAGPYVEYLFNSVQEYKVSGKKYKTDMPIERTFQGGVIMDIGVLPKNVNKLSFSWHVGGSYQVTNYLSNVKSFKPLGCYIAVGFVF